jgi:hypothetical protein
LQGVPPPPKPSRAKIWGAVRFPGGAVRDLTSPLPLGQSPHGWHRSGQVSTPAAGAGHRAPGLQGRAGRIDQGTGRHRTRSRASGHAARHRQGRPHGWHRSGRGGTQHPAPSRWRWRWRWPSGTARARPAPARHRACKVRQAARVASIRAGRHPAPSTQHPAAGAGAGAGAGHRARHGQGQHLQGTGPARASGPHRSGHGQAPHQVKGLAPLPPIHFAVMRTELRSGLGFQRGGLFNPPSPSWSRVGLCVDKQAARVASVRGRPAPSRWRRPPGRAGHTARHRACTGQRARAPPPPPGQGLGLHVLGGQQRQQARHQVQGKRSHGIAPGTGRQAARVASVGVGQHQAKGK